MKQGLNPRRSRGRGNPRGRHPNGGNRNHQFDSNGPEGRIRGSATQILERYLALARDAQSAGDTVAAENLFQHAEHYFRVINVNGGGNNGQQPGRPRTPGMDDDGRDGDGEDQADYGDGSGRYSGGHQDGWRQQRGREDQHPPRNDDRHRQRPMESRPRDGDDSRPQPVENRPDRAPAAAEAQAERGRARAPEAGRSDEDPGEHRPAFLRRREPRRDRGPQAGDVQTEAEQTTAVQPELEMAQPDAAPAPEEAAGEEKPKAKPRRRRTAATAEGEAPARAPRRRTAAKKQDAEAGEDEPAEKRDLETSA